MTKESLDQSRPPRKRGRPRKIKTPEPVGRAPDEPDLFAGYVTDAQLARQRGLSLVSLRLERARGEGPPFTRDGRRVLYSAEGFREWLASFEVKPRKPRK